MSFTWKLPGELPDSAAIARMRHYFPKPNELMPIAWFMGEIYFYESLKEESPQALEAKELCRALGDIAGGIFCFPEVQYVPIWKAWFRYLLPDIILRADDPAYFSCYDTYILVKAIVAFFNIYPYQINEEYPGFRDDVVSTLGTRAIPHRLAREAMLQSGELNRLFVDIWDESLVIELYGFESFEEVNSSMLFCLKYLTVTEIADWAMSLFQIDSPQWHLQLIFSLSAWRTSLKMAQDWNREDEYFLRQILKRSGMLTEYFTPGFKSFDEFIPPENVRAFEQIVSEKFTFELFRTWTDEIWKYLDTAAYNIENGRYLNHDLAGMLRNCQSTLFVSAS